jgi:hypothetical protein
MLIALRLTLFGLLLIPAAVFAADIERTGFRAWIREGYKQPGLKWFGWYFPRRFKILGPVLYLCAMALCACVVELLNHENSRL